MAETRTNTQLKLWLRLLCNQSLSNDTSSNFIFYSNISGKGLKTD